MISASASSADASSSRPPSRNARADSWRRLRSRRNTAVSSPSPSLASFCSSERTRRNACTRSLSPCFMARTTSCFTLSATVTASDGSWRARRTIREVRRMLPWLLVVPLLAGCGGGAKLHHSTPRRAALPAAPISARALTLSGRIVIVNGWQGVVTGQRLRVAAGRYAHSGEGVALVSDAGDFEREVQAPRGEGALRFVRRTGSRLELRSRAGHRFALDLRTLRLTRAGAPQTCPRGVRAGPLPRLRLRFSSLGLRPLPA